MSIRVFIALLLSLVFALSIGFIEFMDMLLQQRLAPLANGPEAAAIIQASVWQDALFSGIFVAVIIGFVFFVMGRSLSTPIRKVSNSMDEFSTTGNHTPLPAFKSAPKEIRNFVTAFEILVENVQKVHKRDVEISRVKSDFISTAAHQLRTPLTGIRWALEALAQEQMTEEQRALIASATEKSHQLVAVVGTLLDISSIESGKYKYDFKPADLNGLVDEVARDFSPVAEKAQVSFLFEKSGDAIPPVKIDRERIRWVLNNLIENAIRYTPAGGNVRVTTGANQERAYVQVRDTGIGIAAEDQTNIFQRFYRAPNAIAKENGGNGLGLYIARTIATDHGGDLGFKVNTEGPGTTFTLSLPVAS